MKSKPARRPTLTYIAELTGYSTSTVSRALKGDPRVTEETREKITSIAEEVGFSQNALASSLRRGGPSTLLGLIIPNVLDPFYAAVVAGVQSAAAEQSREVIIGCHEESEKVQKQLVEQMLEHRVGAILIVPVAKGIPKVLAAQPQFGTVVVAIDRPIANLDSDVITTENEVGARRLTQALLDRGHESIAIISLGRSNYTQRVRVATIKDFLAEQGKAEALVAEHETGGGGETDPVELDEMLVSADPSAIISTAVMPMVRVLESMRRTGRTYALASFDSHPFFELLDTPILVVEQDPYKIGRTAIDILARRTQDSDLPLQHVELPIGQVRTAGLGRST